MKHLVVVLTAFLCLVPSASATVGSLKPSAGRTDGFGLPKELGSRIDGLGLPKQPKSQNKRASSSPSQSDFVITEETEIKVNGHRCRYQDVPRDAAIVTMEVGPDRKTVLKIHFRTAK